MKIPAVIASALLFITSHVSTFASASDISFREIPVQRVTARFKVNSDVVQPGDTCLAVQLRLGRPCSRLPDGSWVYRRYRAALPYGNANGNLVVRFRDNRVRELVLADNDTVTQLAQR